MFERGRSKVVRDFFMNLTKIIFRGIVKFAITLFQSGALIGLGIYILVTASNQTIVTATENLVNDAMMVTGFTLFATGFVHLVSSLWELNRDDELHQQIKQQGKSIEYLKEQNNEQGQQIEDLQQQLKQNHDEILGYLRLLKPVGSKNLKPIDFMRYRDSSHV